MEVEEELTYPLEKEIRQPLYRQDHFDVIEWHVSNYGQHEDGLLVQTSYHKSGVKCAARSMIYSQRYRGVNSVQIIDDFGDVFQ